MTVRTETFMAASDLPARRAKFIMEPYFPEACLSLVEGKPGVGKSTLLASIAAAVSRGGDFIGQRLRMGTVVFMNGEDAVQEVIIPRLITHGANRDNVIVLVNQSVTLDAHGMRLVRRILVKHKPALLVIDPIVHFLGAGIDMHRANEVRQFLASLQNLCKEFGTTCIVARHLRKGGVGGALERGYGSIDFTAAARSAVTFGRDPNNPNALIFAHNKCNVGRIGGSHHFELTTEGGRFGAAKMKWIGASDLSADDLVASPENSEGASQSPRESAQTFLVLALRHGRRSALDVQSAAAKQGLSKRTLERAKQELNVVSVQSEGAWFWSLPEETSQHVAE